MEHYENWETQSSYITPSLYWYNVDRLVNNLHDIRSCIISSAAGSDNIKVKSRLLFLLSQQKLIPQAVPVNKTTRFPNNASFLCEGIGHWHIHLDMLLLALHIMTEDSNNSGEKRRLLYLETMGQVEIFAIEKINLVLQSIVAADDSSNLITRQRFEQELYGLNWVERKKYILFLGYKVLLDKDDKKMTSIVITRFLKQVDKILHQII